MKPEKCPKLDDCPKITMILDKDLLDFQYAEAIRAVCAKCNQGNGDAGRGSPAPWAASQYGEALEQQGNIKIIPYRRSA